MGGRGSVKSGEHPRVCQERGKTSSMRCVHRGCDGSADRQRTG